MNKPDLQLNVYDLMGCSCWDAVVLCGYAAFLGESNLSFPLYTFTGPKIDALLRC